MVDYFDRLSGVNQSLAQKGMLDKQQYMNTKSLEERKKQEKQQQLDMESANKARWFGQAGSMAAASAGAKAATTKGLAALAGKIGSESALGVIASASTPVGWAVGAATLIGMAIYGAVQMRDMQ